METKEIVTQFLNNPSQETFEILDEPENSRLAFLIVLIKDVEKLCPFMPEIEQWLNIYIEFYSLKSTEVGRIILKQIEEFEKSFEEWEYYGNSLNKTGYYIELVEITLRKMSESI